MPHVKLTKALIDKFPIPETGQVFYRDHDMKGFGVRVTAGGVKSFFVEREINRQNRRKTLGRVGVLTVDQARQLAREFMVEIARGNDPLQLEKINQWRTLTLKEVFESYLESRRLNPRTVHDYRYTIEKECYEWLEKLLAEITKSDCEDKHRDIGKRDRKGCGLCAKECPCGFIQMTKDW